MTDGDNGHGQKVLAQITIRLVEISPGVTATSVENTCVDNIQTFGLLEMAREVINSELRKATAPRIQSPTLLPRQIKGLR